MNSNFYPVKSRALPLEGRLKEKRKAEQRFNPEKGQIYFLLKTAIKIPQLNQSVHQLLSSPKSQQDSIVSSGRPTRSFHALPIAFAFHIPG